MKSNVFSDLNFGVGRRLPIVLQTEVAECGLASIAMIARYYGYDVDLLSLRRNFSTSLKGASIRRLIEIAESIGFLARPLRLELDDITQLSTPCLLHWDLNHFVVLKRATAKEIVIHDPAIGARLLSYSEASSLFTGVALELSPRVDFQPPPKRKRISLLALAGNVQGLYPALGQIFSLSLALELFGIFGPFYVQWIVDEVLVVNDGSLLTLLGIGFTFLTVFSVAVGALRSWVVLYLGTVLGVQWATNVFAHLMRLPLDFFEKRHVGDIMSRVGTIQNIRETLTNRLIGAVLDGLMAVFTALIMLVYSLKLSLIVLGTFLLYIVLRAAFYEPFRTATEAQIVFDSRQQTHLLESIRGAQAIKLFNKQEDRTILYANKLVETSNATTRVQRLAIVFNGARSLLWGLENIVVIWLAANAVMNGSFTTGMLFSFSAYAQQFLSRAGNLVDALVEFRMLRLYVERLSDIALSHPESNFGVEDEESILEPVVELCNVSFRYSSGEPWILLNCSLRIEAKSSVALVGPSGSGKTTIAKLILGLLEPTEGKICISGKDIRAVGLRTYRSLAAAVMQEDQLFAGTINENIAFFDSLFVAERVEAAARAAGIHDDIVNMPMGYRSMVGDMGSALSGGQRQRVLLARALYRNPKILVLDEATSHFDVELEKKVNRSISQLNITRLIVAHRPETIASADHVLLLSNGTVEVQR